MKAAVYARVSTKRCEACGAAFDEHESLGHPFKGQDPGMQLRELLEYCERRGWENPVIFVDRASSGKVRPRTGAT